MATPDTWKSSLEENALLSFFGRLNYTFNDRYLFTATLRGHEHGWLNETTKAWQLVYPGLLRAVAELSLGCVCFGMCERLQRVQPKPAGRALLTAMEFLGYLVVIAAMCFLNVGQRGFVPVSYTHLEEQKQRHQSED